MFLFEDCSVLDLLSLKHFFVLLRLKFLFSFCSPSASRNVSDWWLAYWISHTRTTNSTANHVNSTTAYQWNHVVPRVLTADQLGMHVHIVKDTVTFYLVVYGGLAVANTVRLQSQNIVKQNQIKRAITFYTRMKTALSQPMRRKSKINRDLLARVFSRLAPVTCLCFEF